MPKLRAVSSILREIEMYEKSSVLNADEKKMLISGCREEIAEIVGQQRLALGLPVAAASGANGQPQGGGSSPAKPGKV